MGVFQGEKKIALNNDWEFTEKFTQELFDLNYNKDLKKVRIPHTVKETAFNYFDEHEYQMISGYRKVFEANMSWKGKRVALNFAGAAHEAYVYLNGEEIAKNSCGYTAFSVDITKYLKYGEKNVLVVKLDSRECLNIPPFGYVIDYMTYGGIYREVYLEITDMLFIDDIFAVPELISDIDYDLSQNSVKTAKIYKYAKAKARLKLYVDLKDKTDFKELGFLNRTKITYELFDGDELIKEKSEHLLKYTTADFLDGLKNEVGQIYEELEMESVSLWDVTSPKLYKLRVYLSQKDKILDFKEYNIGFRRAEFKASGFYLNGRKLKIRGLNRHQSYPYVGYAMPDSIQRFDADILRKELGLNAVRTSHYPQSKAFIDRCDELGLLVFTEIPGWQHIGNEAWKEQAMLNVANMVKQYRNHPSIILWGVRINESVDDDAFYTQTNKIARSLDPTRATAGVRYLKKSSLLEDVYTYNDFLHDGTNPGVEPKKKVSSNKDKAYLISEFNGHMFPTKSYDSEEHRLEHALRYARVLNDFYKNEDIAGAFGWCMFDYNTHKDFGSGDRICYHGVLDMFRNPKMAAYVYAEMQGVKPVLEVSSNFDIGEHPAGSRGNTYIFTNCDSVKMYKNDIFIKEYTHKDSPFKHLKNGPILIDDYIGDLMIKGEGFSKGQNDAVKKCLNYVARFGMNHLPASVLASGAKALAVYRMTFADAYALYQKYIGNWGGTSTKFRFDAYNDGVKVLSVTKSTSTRLHVEMSLSSNKLCDGDCYDVAAVRVMVKDEHDNVCNFYNGSLPIKLEGEGLEIIGPKRVKILGGMGGTYLKTNGIKGKVSVTIELEEERDKKENNATATIEII